MSGGKLAARCVRGASVSSVVLMSGILSACGAGDDRALEAEDLARVAELHGPALGCFEPVSCPGDCQSTAECGPEQRCVRDREAESIDRAPVALTCGTPVGPRGAQARCTQGDDCESGLCALAGVCLEPCRDSDDCGSQEICRPVEARLGPDALGPVAACVRALVLPGGVELARTPRSLDRGVRSLAIPGALEPAVVLVQGGCEEEQGLEVLSLRSNDLDRELYNRAKIKAGERAENTVLHDGSSLLALLFPNNPALAASARGLTLGVRVAEEQRLQVLVASRAPGPRRLGLNVFYVGGGEALVEGGFVPGEPRVANMLEQLDHRLGEIGLALGDVHEYEVVGALREQLSVLEVPKRKVDGREVEGRPLRLDELFRLSAGVRDPGINVFLIRDMGAYIGISGGIPGPIGVHGSDRSGVALAADVLGDLSGADAVLLHEIGHYLGLFHTTESSGTVLDPLSDTEECPRDRDSDEDRELSTWECEGLGAENLMFWSGAGTELSPQQIEVLASSILLR